MNIFHQLECIAPISIWILMVHVNIFDLFYLNEEKLIMTEI